MTDDSQTSPETETLKRERDEARQLVIEANNSLYGSQGYFHSLNGGEFDKYHLARGIEDLKARLRGHAQTPDLEATVSRIMRIRNGMILDGDAKALIRKEIGALMAHTPAVSPVAWRWKDTSDNWLYSETEPTLLTVGRLNEVQPLYAASPDTSTDRAKSQSELISAAVLALAPLAAIADLYDEREDDGFQIWKDCDQAEIRALTLGLCRKAKQLLLVGPDSSSICKEQP
jgi:hypothetical protein